MNIDNLDALNIRDKVSLARRAMASVDRDPRGLHAEVLDLLEQDDALHGWVRAFRERDPASRV